MHVADRPVPLDVAGRAANAPAALPFVTVVMPVRNEARTIRAALAAVLAQDWPAGRMEILVVDGGSTDGTAGICGSFAEPSDLALLRVLDNPARHAAAAMNVGLAAARGEVIVRIDGHAEVAADFVRRSVEALLASGADAAGGVLETRAPEGAGPAGRAVALAMSTRFGAGSAAFRTGRSAAAPRDADTVPFPAYRRATLLRLGGFDESFPRNQDDELHLRLVRGGGRVVLDPSIRATYRSRATLAAAARQYFGYGFHKARVLRLHGRLPTLRGLAPPALVVLLAASLVAAVVLGDARWLLAGPVPYVFASVAASIAAVRGRAWALLPWMPPAYAALHLGYGAGFLCGVPAALVLPPRPRRPFAAAGDDESPGDAWLVADRVRRLRALLLREGVALSGDGPHLDAGCGRGTSVVTLRALGAHGTIVGADRPGPRLAAARDATSCLAAADLAALPFRDGAFATVLLATAASSIGDPETRRRAAREAVRVMRRGPLARNRADLRASRRSHGEASQPGGVVLWYDLRMPGGSVPPIGARALRRLFPGCRVAIASAGLLPPLARVAARVSPRLCGLLAFLPPLRSHLVAVIRRADDVPPETLARGDGARRVLDLALALPAAVVAAPLVALLAVLVRLTSPGPAFFGAARVGRGGRPFTMWKLRTMREGAAGPAIATGDDARVTALGVFLRRTHLDELPQLWNVLRGDMSLVGPRPEAPEFVDVADPRWRAVLATRPGVTGPAQLAFGPREARRLRGAGAEATYRDAVIPRKLAIDVAHLARRSVVTDVGWIVRTVLPRRRRR